MPEEKPSGTASTWVSRLAVAILIAHTGLLAWMAQIQSPTYDEPGHLVAGVYNWQYGRFDLYCVNPPLVRLVAAAPAVLASPQTNWYEYFDSPVVRPEFDVGRDFVTANGIAAVRYTTWARWACIPFSLLGGYVCFRWARELFGDLAGLTALTLWCFSPTVLGNGSLITSDVAAASLGVATIYAFRGWLRNPNRERALGAGLVFGFALLTKTTWVILFPLLPLLWLAVRTMQRRTGDRRPLLPEARQVGGLLLSGLLLLNLGYGFEGSFQRLEDYSFRSDFLRGPDARESRAGNRFRESWLGKIPVPLPKSFLQGIDLQKSDLQAGERQTCSIESTPNGCWYYYLLGLAWKVPLGVWLLALLSIAFSRQRAIPAGDRILLLLPALSILVLVSTNRGVVFFRYLLPALPFLFIGVTRSVQLAVEGNLVRRIVTAGAVGWFVASSLLVYPHSMHYFNELAGGAEQGHRRYWDDALDWGQDLLFLKEWMDEHPEARPLYLACHTGFDPKSIGIDYRLPFRDATNADDAAIPPGWYAISESALFHSTAFMMSETGRNARHPRLDEFRSIRPETRIGLSIHLFHIPQEGGETSREDKR